ncbi:TonB-dependent receptor [Steroidobacter sp. S1-65]|uniref:TonB-dependent receptor n=1 Tax=Steroidobacter gossypii TaxID=2805490 RepID=A0ABS1WWX7_9GAMM|nr:TonB-dependent receptor [Steroidobacter gossypii]MBM0105468.1 TonB-dependent receptor [Steroidobacter gossypii]
MHDRSAARSGERPVSAAIKRALGPASVTLLALTSFVATGAMAQETAEQVAQASPSPAPQSATGGSSSNISSDTLEAITVTGSRIARADGYEAPTPVSVLGAEDLNKMATVTIADSVNRLPAFTNSQTPRNRSSNISSGTAGTNILNLRGLGANRTLVLQDGKRMVGSTIATGTLSGAVDVNMIPSGLVQRVDVVTGGASAVYGSDALAGVVNFVLDKEFTGVKGNVDYGATTMGDGENYKVSLTAGTGFADDRGHLLFSGEYSDDKGIIGNNRDWADDSFQLMNNPLASQPGQPTLLTVHNAGVANGTYGGLTLSCRNITPYVDLVTGQPGNRLTAAPGACGLRGTQFVTGGAAIPFQFGDLVNGPTMRGGDWEASRVDRATTIALPLQRKTLFGRASFDITDNVTTFVDLQWGKTWSHNTQVVPILNNGGSVYVYQDNAFLAPEIRDVMVANDIDAIEIGTFNGDMHYLQGINERELKRGVFGFEGNFDLGGREWNWDAAYVHGEQNIVSLTPTNRVNSRYSAAINAVRDPATGNIVCGPRDQFLNIVVDPNCRPYNPMGLGVNSPQALDYITDMGHSDITLKQQVLAASMSGEPFDNWAGPVSLAFGAEHRKESSDGWVSDLDQASAFFAGNYKATIGEYDVTEGFVETVFPLLSDVPGADQLDFNGAVRYTDYSVSGEVTTWKAGLVWSPLEDMRFRFTRSRDIRAPGLGELFNQGSGGTGNNIDLGLPGNPTYFMQSQTIGNLNLKPEEADTTGIGVVLTPRFLPGFTMSIDYYKIEVDGTIAVRTTREIIENCYQRGDAQMCSQIHRNAAGFIDVVTSYPENIVGETASGVDVDATYRLPVGPGDLTLRAMGTFVDKLETINTLGQKIDGKGVNSDDAGIGLGAELSGPKYRYLLSAGYDLNPFSVTLTMRGISSGVYNNAFFECAVGSCPSSSELAAMGYTNSINDNHIDAAHYFDLAVNYQLEEFGELYLVIENLTDEDPAKVAGGRGAGFYQGQSNVELYDRFGTMFHGGVRFKF